MKPSLMRAVFASVLVAVAAALFIFNPTEHRLYPKCVFHAVTGWHCPGCGVLRASHQLLHGNFALAFQHNPLFISLLPLLTVVGVRYGRTGKLDLSVSPWLGWMLAGAVILFGICRNLPFAPFKYLAPP